MQIDGKAYLEDNRKLVDKLLEVYMPPDSLVPKSLHYAMRYSVMAGGKRIRPILALASYEYVLGRPADKESSIFKVMASLEMVHTYSLIHDDLPCMDDDDLRRGIPTCHKKFGEAIAVLAGDALHDVAFELIAQTGSADIVIELAHAIGTKGMIGGQVVDVEAEGRDDITKEHITSIHMRKTAALICCAVRTGAILAGADEKQLENLSKYGEKVGLAFQIIDDILDIEGSPELLGKNTGADNIKKKATYPGVVGLNEARKDAQKLIDEALNLFDVNEEDNMLKYIAKYIGQRKN